LDIKSYYVSGNAGKNLDVSGGSSAAGANVWQISNNFSSAQMWKITDLGTGYYKLSSVCSGFTSCLDVANGSLADGANVDQYTDNGSTPEQWQLINLNNGGYYKVICRNSGKCLDVTNLSTDDGANIQQWTCNENTCQQWRLVWLYGTEGLKDTKGETDAMEEKPSLQSTLQIRVFPNQAKEFVKLEGIDENTRVSIVDLQGKLVLVKEVSSDCQLNTSQFKAGIYFINLKTAKSVENYKLIIRK
jgi:hypothetical protein